MPRIIAAFVCGMVLLGAGLAAAQTARQDTLRELMRRIEILTEELERVKLKEVSRREYKSQFGLGPAASQVYFLPDAGVSLAGYGEVVYENFSETREDGKPADKVDRIDFLRNVIYLGFKFNDRFYFNAEIEYEHAKVGDGAPGGVAMEFGYIDAILSPKAVFRAGMILIPMGIINEWHEPPTFYGALRPETERYIIPTTWRGGGFGFLGHFPNGLGYRIFIVEGMNVFKYSANGIRSGRQSTARAIAENFALTGRLDYTGIKDLNLGASFFTGKSGDTHNTPNLDVTTTVLSAHGIYRKKGLEVRGVIAWSQIGNAGELNRLRGLTAGNEIGEQQLGYYVTLAYDILQHIRPEGGVATLSPFIQYERVDTQFKVPDGASKNPANDRRNVILGLMYKPIPTVAFKLDLMQRRNGAKTAVNQLNLAVNYMF